MARRYLAVIQDPRGYPAPGDPLDKAPPEGPGHPTIHSVVMADDYEVLQRAIDKAYDNAQEFGMDAETALRCVIERLEPHVTPALNSGHCRPSPQGKANDG